MEDPFAKHDQAIIDQILRQSILARRRGAVGESHRLYFFAIKLRKDGLVSKSVKMRETDVEYKMDQEIVSAGGIVPGESEIKWK